MWFIAQVVFCMDRCIELSPDCKKFKVSKAECLALLKRYQESQEIAKWVIYWPSWPLEIGISRAIDNIESNDLQSLVVIYWEWMPSTQMPFTCVASACTTRITWIRPSNTFSKFYDWRLITSKLVQYTRYGCIFLCMLGMHRCQCTPDNWMSGIGLAISGGCWTQVVRLICMRVCHWLFREHSSAV